MRNFKDFFNSDSASDHSKKNMEMMGQIANAGNKAMKDIFEVSSKFMKDKYEGTSKNITEMNKPDNPRKKVKHLSKYSKDNISENFQYVASIAKIATASVMSSLESALKHMQDVYGKTLDEFENENDESIFQKKSKKK